MMLLLFLMSLAGFSLAYKTPVCQPGRTVIVHLFNWKWTDIAAECERYLGPQNYCGVQLSPPNEHRVITDPNRPWWERYQPISYLLESRSGNRGQFTDMVQRCNNVGVYIYPDVVINHMCGAGAQGWGSAGSYYDSAALDFPGVPFGATDFNCCQCSRCTSSSCDIENYNDINQVRNCRLVSLVDLELGKDYVRGRVADFLNDMINIGVAGFRVDACKHMWPGDMEAMWSRMSNLNTQWFAAGTQPFIFSEVIDQGGEPITAGEYTHLGRVTEFKFSIKIGEMFRRMNQLKYLVNWGEGWGFLPNGDALVFVDNHDNQRGHGGGGANVLTFYESREYKMATAFKLAHPYGFVRIMSSYSWPGGRWENDWYGPPHNGDMSIKDVPINADSTCGDDWVCEHRWRQIKNMVHFRNVAGSAPLANWWDNDNNQIAFSRGDRGFIAINNEQSNNMNVELNTGMAEGTYCDVISGDLVGGSCTGKEVYVNSGGRAQINIGSTDEDPIVAFHAESRK